MNLGSRLATGALGVILGGVLGFAVSWLVGVYRAWSVVGAPVDFIEFTIYGAALFGVLGLLLGPSVGTLLGSVIAAIYHLEGGPSENGSFGIEVPSWVVVVTLVGIVFGVGWWLRG